MSLEEKIDKLTAAVEANTAALLKGGAAASGKSDTAGAGKGGTNNKTESGDKITREQVNAALAKVKDVKGVDVAKSLIADAAGVSKMADIKDTKFKAVMAACEKTLGDDGGSAEDDNL